MFDTIRVVVADDIQDFRQLLRMNLEIDGRFEIIGEAGDGNEAIQLVRELQPDAIILDLMMPEKSGIEAIPDILRDSPKTKILVLTAHDERRRVKAEAAGAHEYEFKGQDMIRRITSGLIDMCNPEAQW